MALLRCKMCGGTLPVEEGMKIVECEFCGTTQTVPTNDDEKKVNLFNRANRLRIASEFDRAIGVYESIIAEFPNEAEAYWGLCLCKYGIEYVDDPKTARKIPTCHRTSFESIFDDDNYKKAVLYSDSVAKDVYENEANAIDTLQKDILKIVNKEDPFDVFICYKETDDLGNRTVDSVLAQDIYDQLTNKGFKVFFSRITLEDKLGQEFEPYIFSALNSAKVMLAIGTDSEYYNAVWVKNEWSRFLSLMQSDHSKTIIPCYRDVDPYDMPPEFKNLQGQDMSKLGFLQDLTRGVTKIIRGSEKSSDVSASNSLGALTKRGYFFLEDGDFNSANEYFNKALDENPEDPKAYIGLDLAELHLKNINEFNDICVNITSKNFERAIRFSSGEYKAKLESIKENADKKFLISRLISIIDGYNNRCFQKTQEIKDDYFRAKVYMDCGESISVKDDQFDLRYKMNRLLDALNGFICLDEYKESKLMAERCKELIYDYASKEMNEVANEKDHKILSIAEKGLLELGKLNFRDSNLMIEKCKQLHKQIDYDHTLEKMNKAISDNDHKELLSIAEEFDSFGEFSDSKSMADKCRKPMYNCILEKMNEVLSKHDGYYEDMLSVAEKFDSLGEHSESKLMAEKCRKQVYDEALEYMNNAIFSFAIEIFEALGEYSDSKSMAEKCRKQAYDSALENANKAISNEDYKELAYQVREFKKLGEYGDSKSLAEKYQKQVADFAHRTFGSARRQVEKYGVFDLNYVKADSNKKSIMEDSYKKFLYASELCDILDISYSAKEDLNVVHLFRAYMKILEGEINSDPNAYGDGKYYYDYVYNDKNKRMKLYYREQAIEKNNEIYSKIERCEKEMEIQKKIFEENCNKTFGEGGKLKRSSRKQLNLLRIQLESLNNQLR